MDPNDYVYSEHTAFLEEKCASYSSLEATLEFCREHGRQPSDTESDNIETNGWDSDTYGAGVLESLKADIECAKTAADVATLINNAENAVDGDITCIENEISGYPSA